MTIHIRIYRSPDIAQNAFDALRSEGFTVDQLTLLAPHTSNAELPSGPSVETPHPGACGVKAGDVVGSLIGWAGGVTGVAATLVFIPAVGPIAAVGALTLASVVGATAGGIVGHVVQHAAAPKFPYDYAFVYEDALRRGRWLLIIHAPDEHQWKTALPVLNKFATESLEDARETWWRHQREIEMQDYEAAPYEFARIEPVYRQGFEAALATDLRGHPYADILSTLQERYPNTYQAAPFTQGYQRGQEYFEYLVERYQEKLPPESSDSHSSS